MKKDRFVTLGDADPTVDWNLVKRAQYLAGLKGYVTNINPDTLDGPAVVAAYHDPLPGRTLVQDDQDRPRRPPRCCPPPKMTT